MRAKIPGAVPVTGFTIEFKILAIVLGGRGNLDIEVWTSIKVAIAVAQGLCLNLLYFLDKMGENLPFS